MATRDTDANARTAQTEALRRIGGEARVEIVFAMSEEARAISISALRDRHPDLSHEEARLRVLRRILGDALYDAAYGRSAS